MTKSNIATVIENQLSVARTKLIIDKPFLGALVLRLPLKSVTASWCKTTATDAKILYYNPEFVASLSANETQFVLAHEALHCALSHFTRRLHRNKSRWDLACDYAINPILLKEGLHAPPQVVVVPGFEGMTAEEIYPCIEDNTEDEPMDNHLYDSEEESSGGQGNDSKPQFDETGNSGADEKIKQPASLAKIEADNLSTQWQTRLAGAAQQAMQAGKLSAEMARLVDHYLQPKTSWRALLSRYMTNMTRDDFTYMRPSRREGQAIFPSLRSQNLNIAVVIDTSSSIKDKEINAFLAEINAIKAQMRVKITVYGCDHQLSKSGPWVFETWEELVLPEQIIGGGGTDFRPIFEHYEKMGWPPDCLVYFTDGDGRFPKYSPVFPVIWLIKGKSKVPWGQRIQLN